jgi:membrane protein DedA with SNARE-associated domain
LLLQTADAGSARKVPLMSASPLPGFLADLAPILDHYGYWAIAAFLLLENIGVPVVPGEFSLIAGAIYAGTGRLNVAVVGIIAVTASFMGADIGYLIGRFGGRALVLRYGRYVFVKHHHVDRAEAVISRYGGMVVVIARFIVGLRELNGIVAGITGMRWARFLVYNAIGAVAWVAVWDSAGYLAGNHIGAIYADVQRYSLYALIALVLVVAALITRRVIRRKNQQAAASAVRDRRDAKASRR